MVSTIRGRQMHHRLASYIEVEIDKLIKADLHRVVQYPIWLANVLPVKKKWTNPDRQTSEV